MKVIPGSFENRAWRHHVGAGDYLTMNQVVSKDQLADKDIRYIELEPGQCSLHDLGVVHGSATKCPTTAAPVWLSSICRPHRAFFGITICRLASLIGRPCRSNSSRERIAIQRTILQSDRMLRHGEGSYTLIFVILGIASRNQEFVTKRYIDLSKQKSF